MKAIITGATGFIGIALCRELLKNGYFVTAVARLKSAKIQKLENLKSEFNINDDRFNIIELDLDNIKSLSEKGICADVFYHLAWNGSSGLDREDFAMQYSNIEYTANAVYTARKCGCKKIIVSGSQAEYGVIKGLASEQKTVLNPFMMYGAAKLSAYHMSNVLSKQIGINLIWSRIYSIYGVGENKDTLISYIVEMFKSGKTPELSSCNNMWNFMYITDCVRALRMLFESENAEGIYNIASNDTRILREFVEQVRYIISPYINPKFDVKTVDEKKVFWLAPDCTRLKSLGFECSVSFEEGIKLKLEEV